MLIWWLLRRPENLDDAVSYFFLLPPFLSLWAVRMRPCKVLAVISGVLANFANYTYFLIAALAVGFSGKQELDFALTAVFALGNTALIVVVWMGELTAFLGRRFGEKATGTAPSF
jgi:hypothetical protein